MSLDAVGLLLVEKPEVATAARTVKGLAAEGFQVKVEPLAIVATRTSPKLSSDHRPGSSVVWLAGSAVPQPLKSVALVTVAPELCVVAGDVPNAPLVALVKVLVPLPV